MRRRKAADGPAGGGQTDENGGPIDDGYGQALAQWRINEAVERAEGRAKTFLRQLWCACLVVHSSCQHTMSSVGSNGS